MCEKETWKRGFLLRAFRGEQFDDCCLFKDACTYLENPECDRHGSSSCVPCCIPAASCEMLSAYGCRLVGCELRVLGIVYGYKV